MSVIKTATVVVVVVIISYSTMIFFYMTIIFSWPIYAFGQITDDVAAIRMQQSVPTVQVIDDLPEL